MANLQIIKNILKDKGLTVRYLANELGMSEQGLQKLIRENSTKIETLESIAKILKVSIMVFFDEQTSGTNSNSNNNGSDDYTSIPVVDISVAAGCGGYNNADYMEVADCIQMPHSMIKKNARYFCVRVKGESMTPTILDSSYVVVKLLEKPEWAYMPDNHVYVVSDREGRTYIKRVKNRLREHGFIVCMSDNVDKANYPNFNLQENEINSVLHAEWYISAKMPNINDTYYKKVNDLEDDMDVLKGQMKQVLDLLSNK